MARVERAEQLEPAWREARRFDPVVFAEPWITGGEYNGRHPAGQGAALDPH